MLADARVGGMLSGKAGVVHFHLGQHETMIDLLWQVVNSTSIPITQMYPTHMTSRGPALTEQAAKWLGAGGMVDFTADDDSENETGTMDALLDFAKRGLPLSRISVSSDAFGSLPVFDAAGNLVTYEAGSPMVLLETLHKLVLDHGWTLDAALQFFTANPATFLGFPNGKGVLREAGDADLLVLDSAQLTVKYLFAKGQVMKTPAWVKRDMFEAVPQLTRSKAT
jgi:beta-aspartyl-dipeptidase (metallo-type)